VAPISVTIPFSTAASKESCCDLLNLCISSIKRMDLPVLSFAWLITFLTSFTPDEIALKV
jgi:hypothetical protein